MSEITRDQAIQIVEDIRTAISAGSVTNTMEAQVLEYCVSVLGRRIVEASLSEHIENLPDVAAFLAGISPSTTLKALLKGITDAVGVINANIGNGYVYAGIATPSGTPVNGKVFYLAKQAGQYANFGGLTVTEGVNILKRNGSTWTQEQLLSMADIHKNPLIGYYECDTAGDTAAKTVTAAGYVLPATGGSVKIKMANRNTVANATLNINSTGAKPLYYNGQRAGVGNTWDTNEIIEVFYDGAKYQAYNVAGSNGDGVFDISAYNLTDGQPTPYEDLAAALGPNGDNVPLSLRKGGMSIKFVHDNQYVQYRLMAQNFTTDVTQWQGVDDVPTVGSDNLIKSGSVAEVIGANLNITCAINAGGEYANLDFILAEGEDVGFYVDADAIAASGMVIKLYIYRAEGGDRISHVITNKQQYASLRAIFGNFSGTIYGFAYYITNKSGAGNITTTFHYYGINDAIQELDDKIDAEVEATNTEVSRVDKYSASAQKNAGGIQSFSFNVTAGAGVEPLGRFKVSIAKDSKFNISIDTSVLASGVTSIAGYLYYSDDTRSSSIGIFLSSGSGVITASKDIIAVDFYIPGANIASTGVVGVTIDITSLLKEKYDFKFAALQKYAIKLIGIAYSTGGLDLSDTEVGDLYFNTTRNKVYEITEINPVDTRQRLDLTESTAVFEYNGELYIYDGVSLTKYHNNNSKDNKVVFDYSEYLVGPEVNNDNTGGDRHTYIYKDLIIDDIAADEFLRISCDSITNSPASTPIKVYGITEQEASTVVKSLGIGTKDVYPSTNHVKYKIRLYPSTSGMSVDHAIFKNVKVEKIKSEMPAYYVKDDYLKNKIDVIRGLMKAANGYFDAFAFVTDVHWPNNMKHTPDILAYLQRYIVLPRLMMGGDYSDGINTDANNAFDSFNGRVYKAAGNHEYMNYLAELRDNSDMHATDITGADIWAFLNSGMYDAVIGDASKNYYYVDNPVQKMRYIFLNVFTDGSAGEFEQAQQTWLSDVALNLPSNYTAIIICHHMMDCTWPAGSDLPTDWTPVLTPIGQIIANIADSYNGAGEIACILHGHTHLDLMKKTDGGIPIFATTCDKANPDIDETSGRATYTYGKRTNGTIYEQAFDIVVINKTAKKVSLVRIGCPADNSGDTPLEIREQTYGA